MPVGAFPRFSGLSSSETSVSLWLIDTSMHNTGGSTP